MSDDTWPPPAPRVNKAFKRAHDATNDNKPPPPALPIVTKKEKEELESKLQRSKPSLTLTPPDMKPKISSPVEQEIEKRLARMKERLQKSKGKARDDFNRSM